MNLKKLFSLLCILFIVLGCKNDDESSILEEQVPESEAVSILFIGNSHTNYNGGIDTQVNSFARSVDVISVATQVAPNGFTLENHLNSQTTLNAIDSQHWDYIILQENTQRAAYEPEKMLESISQFSQLLQSSSATIYLFKTWAYDGEAAMNGLLDTAYAQATSSSRYPTIAIGSYWRTFSTSFNIDLYNRDGIHPNDTGTFLSAGLFFKKIFDYTDLSEVTHTSTLDETTAALIKEFITEQNF